MKYLVLAFLVILGGPAIAETSLEATQRIAGTYHGEWVMYKYKDAQSVELTRWTDELVAKNPMINGNRAEISIENKMVFRDGSVRVSNFVEGYLTNHDGSAGNRFYEINSQLIIYVKLSPNDWTFYSSISEGELWALGFDPVTVKSSSHVTTRSVTFQNGKDTDYITRVSTVQWIESGVLKTAQFVSLEGKHSRQ